MLSKQSLIDLLFMRNNACLLFFLFSMAMVVILLCVVLFGTLFLGWREGERKEGGIKREERRGSQKWNAF